MADIITQAELGAVLHEFNTLRYRILGIRRRIECNGATVEEGIYSADSNSGDPISGHDRAVHGSSLCGLDIETKGLPSDIYDNVSTKPKPVPELPDWLEETPEHTYQLDAWNDGGSTEQEITVPHSEYINLKRHLAKLRGIAVPEEAHA